MRAHTQLCPCESHRSSAVVVAFRRAPFALASDLLKGSVVIWHDLWNIQISPAEKVLRTALVYGGLAVLKRVAGKRDLAQLNSFDLVVMRFWPTRCRTPVRPRCGREGADGPDSPGRSMRERSLPKELAATSWLEIRANARNWRKEHEEHAGRYRFTEPSASSCSRMATESASGGNAVSLPAGAVSNAEPKETRSMSRDVGTCMKLPASCVWSASCAGLMLLLGFGVVSPLDLVGAGDQSLPGLFAFRSATVGDGVMLPILSFGLVRAGRWAER